MASYPLAMRSAKLDGDIPPTTRTHFKKFLAQNPNYFGNFPGAKFDPVEEISGNTTFEALTCIGYNQTLGYIQGTIAIKQPIGYLGGLCTQGSEEWVRFYIDYGDEAGWQDLGLAGFNVHDIPNADDCRKVPEKPLYYCVTLAFTPNFTKQKFCDSPVLPVIRGIESWNVPPPAKSPDWVPVYGNVLDQNIQIRPRLLLLKDLVDLIPKDAVTKLPSQVTNAPDTSISLPDPATVDLGALAKKYGKDVAAARFGFLDLHKAITSSESQQELLAYHNTWSNLKLDFPGALKELEGLSGDTQYEQLDCLGLEYSLDRLVATFHTKLPSGFSGTLCTAGSTEYVTFWSDWDDNCTWTLLGTVQVNVHDIPTIPTDGLAYAAVLPIDLQSVVRSCEQPKIARVRAVLSWNVASSTTNPDAVPFYGNILDAHVQIRPGTPTLGPSIQVIGGIPTPEIDGTGMTVKNAHFFFGYTLADPNGGRACPFGQNIIFQSPSPPGIGNYRIWAQPAIANPPPKTFLTTSITVYNFTTQNYVTYTPQTGTGWLPYLNNQSENIDAILGSFSSTDNQPWQFQLETDTGLTTRWYVVQMDNQDPSVSITTTSPGTCGNLPVGGMLQGTFTATDAHFSHWELSISPPQNVPTIDVIQPASSGTTEVPPNPGAWQMSTAQMQACGYVVTVQAWDLAILNSAAGPGNGASMAQGFCLTPASGSNGGCGWEVVEEG